MAEMTETRTWLLAALAITDPQPANVQLSQGKNNKRFPLQTMNVITFGPMVTATASARRSTPCSMRALASAPNFTSLAYARVRCGASARDTGRTWRSTAGKRSMSAGEKIRREREALRFCTVNSALQEGGEDSGDKASDRGLVAFRPVDVNDGKRRSAAWAAAAPHRPRRAGPPTAAAPLSGRCGACGRVSPPQDALSKVKGRSPPAARPAALHRARPRHPDRGAAGLPPHGPRSPPAAVNRAPRTDPAVPRAGSRSGNGRRGGPGGPGRAHLRGAGAAAGASAVRTRG